MKKNLLIKTKNKNTNLQKQSSFIFVMKKNKQIILTSSLLISIIIVAIILGAIFIKPKQNNINYDKAIYESKKILSFYLSNSNASIIKNSLLNDYNNDTSIFAKNGTAKFNINSLKIVTLNLGNYNAKVFPSFNDNNLSKIMQSGVNLNNLLSQSKRLFYSTWLNALASHNLYLLEAVDMISNNLQKSQLIPLSTIFLYDANHKTIYFLDFDKFNGIGINIANNYHNLNAFFDKEYAKLFPKSTNSDKIMPNPLLDIQVSAGSSANNNYKYSFLSKFNKKFFNNIISSDSEYEKNNVNKLYGVIPFKSKNNNVNALTSTNAAFASAAPVWNDMNTYSSYLFSNSTNSNISSKNSNISDDFSLMDWNYENGAHYLPNSSNNQYDMTKINFNNGGAFAKQTFDNIFVQTSSDNEDTSVILNNYKEWNPKHNVEWDTEVDFQILKIADYFEQNALKGKNVKENKIALETHLITNVKNENYTYFYNPGVNYWKYNAIMNADKFDVDENAKFNIDNGVLKNNTAQNISISNNKNNPYFNANLYNDVFKIPNYEINKPWDEYGIGLQLYNTTNQTPVTKVWVTKYFDNGSTPISLFGPLGKNFLALNLMANDGSMDFDNNIWTISDLK